MKKIAVLFAFLTFGGLLQAQKTVTLEEAVDIALKKNFDIQVARNNAEVSKINNTKGNAGMLPSVSVNGSGSSAYNNVYQKLSSGTENKYSDQFQTVFGANAELSWTLYDGGKMFIAKKRLEELQSLGELQFNSHVMDVTYDVIAAYYDIVRQKQTLTSLNEVINYNKQRALIAETSFKSGMVAKTELLQAKIDLNVANENAINQESAINTAQRTFNSLLGETTIVYDAVNAISQASLPSKSELLLKIESSNANILEMKKQIDIANLDLKVSKKGNLPTLNMKGGYYFSQTNNSKGSTLTNRNNGLQVGGTLSIPLYTGGETKRKVALAKNELLTAQYNLDNAKLQVTTEVENAYTNYENQQKLLQMEQENNLLAKENMEISLQRLKLGQTTSLELHQAQENYAQSCTRLINFKYKFHVDIS